jgi:hypothetical protein
VNRAVIYRADGVKGFCQTSGGFLAAFWRNAISLQAAWLLGCSLLSGNSGNIFKESSNKYKYIRPLEGVYKATNKGKLPELPENCQVLDLQRKKGRKSCHTSCQTIPWLDA